MNKTSGQIEWWETICQQQAARIEQLEAALRIYASDEVWRINGRCNPNSANFNGQFTARAALDQKAST